jgi:hypothetical protein
MLQDMLKDRVNSMKTTSSEDLLAALGLERRRSSVAVVGSYAALLATGMILGAGIALLMAPKSGRALRQEIRIKASDFADRIGERAGEATSEVRSALSLDDGHGQKAPLDGKREENAHPKI